MRRVFRLPFGRAHITRDVDDELAFHIEMRTQKLVALGLTPDAARREALRQFGDVNDVRQSCVTLDQERDRAMHRARVFDELRQDLVYAVRTLRRNVGFTVVVVLTLAFGIGANTAIFSLIDAMLLRQLPVVEPERLVAIGDPTRVSSMSSGSPRTDLISYPLYLELRDQQRIVTGVLASGRSGTLDVRIDRAAAAEHPRARLVSGNYFQVLGVHPAMGRIFDGSEDAVIGASPVAIISYGYWTRRFGGDPAAVGREITINGTQFTIIGVAAPRFTGEIVGAETDLWVPIAMQTVLRPTQPILADRGTSWLLLLGRLAPGVTLQQARDVLGDAIRRSIADHARSDQPGAAQRAMQEKTFIASGAKGFSRVRHTYAVPLLTLMAGVGVLLLIICANVATLLLARAVARGREMSVRLALGAARTRLVRQLLTESMLLALLSAAAGLLVAWYGSRMLLLFASDDGRVIPINVRLDVPVLAFTAVLSALAVLLFGLVPALRASRVDLASSMRDRAGGSGAAVFAGGGQRVPIGRLLIGAQVALSLTLLVGAALLVRSLRNVESSDTGVDRERLLIVAVDAMSRGYRDGRLATLGQELRARIAQVPGVSSVAYSQIGIFSGSENGYNVKVPGFVAHTEDDSSTTTDDISAGYVRTSGIRLLQGREFTEQDDAHAARVALVNESFSRFYFRGTNPIGRTITVDDSIPMQVVGVIADVAYHALAAPPDRRVYVPYDQLSLGNPEQLRFVVRTDGDPALIANAVRKAIVAADAQLPIGSIDPLTRLMWESIAEQRLVTRLATGFGILSMVLAAIGLYGVMTYAITRRTGEIGLRVALGAQRGDVLRLILFDALGIVAIGLTIGIPLAMAATRLLRSQLHGVGPADPAAFGAALFVLSGSAVLAALLPALRATRVAPLVALRQE